MTRRRAAAGERLMLRPIADFFVTDEFVRLAHAVHEGEVCAVIASLRVVRNRQEVRESGTAEQPRTAAAREAISGRQTAAELVDDDRVARLQGFAAVREFSARNDDGKARQMLVASRSDH